MTSVLQFTYQSSVEHLIWALVLGTILLQGPGRFSWDHFIRRKVKGDINNTNPGMAILSVIMVAFLTVVAAHEAMAVSNSDVTPWFECWDAFWGGKG